jgi:hypothetical protein
MPVFAIEELFDGKEVDFFTAILKWLLFIRRFRG